MYCFSMQMKSRETSAAQKNLRKKITKDAKSNAHITATNILEERQKKVQSSIKCFVNTNQLLKIPYTAAHFVSKENRPYSDYENLVSFS